MDTLNFPKMAAFIVLVAAVIGGIFYLDSQKVKRDGGIEAVTVIPRAPSEPTEVKKEAIPSKYFSPDFSHLV